MEGKIKQIYMVLNISVAVLHLVALFFYAQSQNNIRVTHLVLIKYLVVKLYTIPETVVITIV